jgi:hypothetical protein
MKMKLVQKLPIGLSLACMMMLSSCSKEDAMSPQPEVGSVNEHSGAKTDALVAVPVFPSTAVAFEVNYNSFPRFWEKMNTGPTDLAEIPAGSSSLTALWNHQYDKPWDQALSPVPSTPAGYSMLTAKSYTPLAASVKNRSHVRTKIEGLTPGKTYAVTFYVATTRLKDQYGGYQWTPAYAKTAEVKILGVNNGMLTTNIDLTGKEAQWIKKTITFKAKYDYASFQLSALTPQEKTYSYINIFVAPNAIKELTTAPQMTVF